MCYLYVPPDEILGKKSDENEFCRVRRLKREQSEVESGLCAFDNGAKKEYMVTSPSSAIVTAADNKYQSICENTRSFPSVTDCNLEIMVIDRSQRKKAGGKRGSISMRPTVKRKCSGHVNTISRSAPAAMRGRSVSEAA